jgi:hypothetical protein
VSKILILIDTKDRMAISDYDTFMSIINLYSLEHEFYTVTMTYKRISRTLRYEVKELNRNRDKDKFSEIDTVVVFGNEKYRNNIIKKLKLNRNVNVIYGTAPYIILRILILSNKININSINLNNLAGLTYRNITLTTNDQSSPISSVTTASSSSTTTITSQLP